MIYAHCSTELADFCSFFQVNIIPLIAKADTLTTDECNLFKKQILNEIQQNRIKMYEFPDTSEDDEEHKINKSLRERVPFAVVGANAIIEIDGKKVINT